MVYEKYATNDKYSYHLIVAHICAASLCSLLEIARQLCRASQKVSLVVLGCLSRADSQGTMAIALD